MANEIVKEGSLLEGAKCEIYTRKETVKGLHRDPITSVMMLKYELNRNCSVEITKEHDLKTDEDIALRRKLAVFNSLGDKLKADSISIYIEQKLPLKVTVQEGATATHGGRFMSTSKRTVAKISRQLKNLPEMLAAPAVPKLLK